MSDRASKKRLKEIHELLADVRDETEWVCEFIQGCDKTLAHWKRQYERLRKMECDLLNEMNGTRATDIKPHNWRLGPPNPPKGPYPREFA